MSFPIDQLMSSPKGVDNRSLTAQDAIDGQTNLNADNRQRDINGRRALDIANNDLENSQRSDFQRHLDDTYASNASADINDSRSSQRTEPATTHGATVSEVAKATVTSNPEQQSSADDDEAMSQGAPASNKGQAVSDVAVKSNSRSPVATPSSVTSNQQDSKGISKTADTSPGQLFGDDEPLDAEVPSPSVASSAGEAHSEIAALKDVKKTDGTLISKASAADPKTSGTTVLADAAPVAPGATHKNAEPSQETADVPTHIVGATDVSQHKQGIPADTPDGSQSESLAATTAKATAETKSALSQVPMEPGYNEKAQKVEGANTPGRRANGEPRSMQGAEAHHAKSANGKTAPTPESGSAAEETSMSTASEEQIVSNAMLAESQSTVGTDASDSKPSTGEAVASSTDGETDSSEDVSEEDAQSQVAMASPPVPETQASIKTDGAQPSSISASGSEQALAATKSQATTNASPTGTEQVQANSQGKSPLSTPPSGEEVQIAGGGIDKRGQRNGEKSNDVAEAAKTRTAFQVSTPSGQQKSGVQAAPAAAQATAQSSAPTATQPQSGQQPTSPTPPPAIMTDPMAALNMTESSAGRGAASMEIDPATGALHLTGTGTAKSAAPSLSEVTLQFTRARMLQAPAKDIAVQIAKYASNGVNRFDIRISPPELGRIEVKLEISEGGKVSAHLVADKPETLDLLQKDRGTLEKALAEAGLDTDSSSLGFSMREGGEDENGFGNHGLAQADEASDGVSALRTMDVAELEVSAYGFDIVRMKHLDISI